MTQFLLGCSGWSYDEWTGSFYLDKGKNKLSAYSSIFSTVEINSTFYAYPKKEIVIGWLRYSPENFIFCAKLPGQITHDKELLVSKGVEEDLNQFLQLMQPLADGGKLGCLLVQLPPRLKFNSNKVEAFYAILPSEQFHFAIEFRNKTWLSDKSFELLKKYNLAYTIIDEPHLPPDVEITTNFAYFRWHGRGKKPWYNYHYSEDELKEWVPRIQEAQESANTVYGYFNNHYHGYAPENCLDILDMLGIATSVQQKTRGRIKQFRKTPPKPQPKAKTLFDFIEDAPKEIVKKKRKETTESLLRLFADEGRILNGRVMKNDELKDLKIEKQRISTNIRDYTILIDEEKQRIFHNCGDWKRRKQSKKFCKHLVRLFLSLSKLRSKLLLKNISENLEDWTFE